MRASWEYPFAVAGVNLTYMLEEVFDLRDKRVGSLIHDRLPGSAAGRSFLSLLAGSSSVFESVSTADSTDCMQTCLPGKSGATCALPGAPAACSILTATSIKQYSICLFSCTCLQRALMRCEILPPRRWS